jgi:hypothetical protein
MRWKSELTISPSIWRPSFTEEIFVEEDMAGEIVSVTKSFTGHFLLGGTRVMTAWVHEAAADRALES